MAEVTLILNNKEHKLQVRETEKILDAALKAGIDAPYSCRSSICSTCMAKLVKGHVEMEMNHVLTDQELEEGFVVTCQSKPTTPEVVLTYDF